MQVASRLQGSECRLDRVSRRTGTTPSVETPQRAPQEKKSLCRRAHKQFLQKTLFGGRSKLIQAHTDHKVEGPDLHCQQRCVLAHDVGTVSFTAGKKKPCDRPKNHLEPRMASSVPQKRRGLHPGTRHLLVREVCGRFAFCIVPETTVR